jgi:hypothetical protein
VLFHRINPFTNNVSSPLDNMQAFILTLWSFSKKATRLTPGFQFSAEGGKHVLTPSL